MTKNIYVLVSISILLAACSSVSKNGQPKQGDPKAPFLKNAEVKTIWIPDRIEGNKYEEGHFIHLIDKQATWGEK